MGVQQSVFSLFIRRIRDWENNAFVRSPISPSHNDTNDFRRAIIVEHLTHSPKSQQLAYFYCPPALNPIYIYGSLIRQILESSFPELPDYIESYYNTNSHRHPYEDDLKSILPKLLTNRSSTIIVDGLEECTDVAQYLFDLTKVADVRLLITCREKPELVPNPGLLKLELHPTMMLDDLQMFIAQEVERRPALRRLKPEIKNEVVCVVTAGADEGWRWVKCSLEQIARMRTNKNIRDALSEMKEEEIAIRGFQAEDAEDGSSELAQQPLESDIIATEP